MIHAAKMIVTDLDGTLLRSDKTISEKTRSILRRCREAGLKVVYATGRGGSAERVTSGVVFDAGITMNGAVAKISGRVIYNRLIPYRIARPILTACHNRGMNMTSEISGMHYSNFVVSDIWPRITNYEIIDFSQHKADAEKIYTPNPAPEDISFIVQQLPAELYFVVTADAAGFLGQIMHRDATKAKAVAAAGRCWGILPQEIVAFGDDLNDIDMLSYAGTGVAMENAVDEVKAAADHICLHNDEDGLAKWIEEYLFEPENTM